MTVLSLGYNVYSDDRDFEQEGLTGEVKRYSVESMSFPCFIVCSTTEVPVEMYKVKVLKNMLATSSSSSELLTSNTINIYYSQDSQVVTLGKILSNQVKSFLSLFENNIVDGYLDENTKLEGMHLYVLSD